MKRYKNILKKVVNVADDDDDSDFFDLELNLSEDMFLILNNLQREVMTKCMNNSRILRDKSMQEII
jgi:hypothetical protein